MVCTHCKVFGHCDEKCYIRPRTVEEETARKNAEANEQGKRHEIIDGEFKKVQYKKNTIPQQRMYGYNRMNNRAHQRKEYRQKSVENNDKGKGTMERSNIKERGTTDNSTHTENGIKKNNGKEKRNVNQFDALNGISNEDSEVRILKAQNDNQFENEGDLSRDKNGKSLSMEENIVKENEDVDIFVLWQKQEEMVDMFMNNKRIPTDEELETWSRYMCEWYKERLEANGKVNAPL